MEENLSAKSGDAEALVETEDKPEAAAEPLTGLPSAEKDFPKTEEPGPRFQSIPEKDFTEEPSAREKVIGPEDTMGTEDEINSLLEQIDAEEIPAPPEPPVRELSAASKSEVPKPEERVKLLDYLMSLTSALPEHKRTDFTRSDFPLKIEAVKNILRGKQGLHREFSERGEQPQPITQDKVKKSFSFVSQLADYLPNQDIKTVLKKKLETISRKLSEMPGDKFP
jgi:hypothetical protein